MVATSLNEILQDARDKHYVVGYFEVWNLESARALVRAAEKEKSPVIIGFGGANVHRWDGLEYYAALAIAAVQNAKVAASSLWNEPSGIEQIIRAISKGFMGVMVDGSSLPFQDNMSLTKRVVEIAHSADVWVEGQVDELPTATEGRLTLDKAKWNLTTSANARDFVNMTDVDGLAVSVGNVHGLYRGGAKLDFERIKEIGETTDVPLVLHGGSGIPDESVAEAAKFGVCKVNVGVVLKHAFRDAMKRSLNEQPDLLPEAASRLAEQELTELLQVKMRAYGSSNRV